MEPRRISGLGGSEMILTITMNPSIDISYPLETLKLDTVNRVRTARKTAGGKGLNVTRILNQLDKKVIASGLIGGFLGEEIKSDLKKNGIRHEFLTINGESRNCIALLHDGQQTEILESGPVISEKEMTDFLKHFKDLAKNADFITLSGSLPEGVPLNFYSKMIRDCRGASVVLDCAGEAMKEAIRGESKPLLIKPNIEELSGLLGRKVTTNPGDLQNALSDPLFEKIEWIIVTMGSEGAFAKHNENFYLVRIPKIHVLNPVGSGDATVAGLTAALESGDSDEDVLKQGNALGMLNAQEATTGYVDLANYQELFDQIQVKKL